MGQFLIAFGTRPSAVKLAPVVHALRSRGAVADVCLLKQQEQMFDCCLESLEIAPRYCLSPPRGDLAARLGNMVQQVAPLVTDYDGVVVVGDTISDLAGAMAGAYVDVPVAHVEAGLRTRGREPWPEEMTRRQIDAISHWHFCPTDLAVWNCLGEWIERATVFLTGNTIVDGLQRLGVQRQQNGQPPEQTVLITLHRRENWPHMARLAASLRKLAKQHPATRFVWPVHSNPEIGDAAQMYCHGRPNVLLKGPLPHNVFLTCLSAASLVITDSGGVQEEAAVLGVPTLLVRQVTERPESVDYGVTLLTGQAFYDQAHRLLGDAKALAAMNRPCDCFGDGRAADRIADILTTGSTPLGEWEGPKKEPSC